MLRWGGSCLEGVVGLAEKCCRGNDGGWKPMYVQYLFVILQSCPTFTALAILVWTAYSMLMEMASLGRPFLNGASVFRIEIACNIDICTLQEHAPTFLNYAEKKMSRIDNSEASLFFGRRSAALSNLVISPTKFCHYDTISRKPQHT